VAEMLQQINTGSVSNAYGWTVAATRRILTAMTMKRHYIKLD